MTSFFRFVNKQASYTFGMISLAYAPVNVTDFSTVHNRTALKNGSCCTVRPDKVRCLQKFRHFWMIIGDLFFESGSTEATK